MAGKLLCVTLLAIAIAPFPAPAQEPGPFVYELSAPLSRDARTRILILASEHLRVLGPDFRPSMLDHLLEVLEGYRPDMVSVEALPPEEIARLVREASKSPQGAEAQLLEAFAGEAVRLGEAAQGALGLTYEEARDAADSLLGAGPASAGLHGRLAVHFLAAYDLPSAVLQWSYATEGERRAAAGMDSVIAAGLEREAQRPNEQASLGIALARRLGLPRVHSMDDHVDDELGLRTGLNDALMKEIEGSSAYAELTTSSYFEEAASRLPDAARTGDLLPMYRRLNSIEHLNDDVSAQWHFFFRTRLPSKRDRVRVGLWEARNLHMAARIRTYSAWHPGGRVVVIVGAAHKPFLDSYLGRMMDVEIVQLDQLMDPRESSRPE